MSCVHGRPIGCRCDHCRPDLTPKRPKGAFPGVAPEKPKATNEPERFALARDDSAHWYLIPASKREAWSKWRDLPEDHPRRDSVPRYAERIDSPTYLTFTDPKDVYR